jgi:peptide/nickel transport system permease protein
VLAYIFRRLLQAIPLLLGVATIMFLLLQLAPGDPISAMAGEYPASDAYVEAMNEKYGFDDPVIVQYWNYITTVATGDLGYSFSNQQPVVDVIRDRVWPTFLLSSTALIFGSVVGVGIGLIAGTSRRRWLDHSVTGGAVALLSIPVFWFAQMLVLLFALQLQWLPVQGMKTARADYTGWANVWDVTRHLILPAFALALGTIGALTRIVRTTVTESLGAPFIETARAKGLSRNDIIRSHVLRNSLLPAVTVIGYSIGFLLSGAVLIETVFGWPGMGLQLNRAIENRDNQVVIGILLFVSLAVVIANLLTDIVYWFVDPRIRRSAGA